MARKLTDREMRKIDRWARSNKKSELVDFLSDLPSKIIIPKQTLLGSVKGSDFYIHGYTTTSTIIDELYYVDDQYIDSSQIFFTKTFNKRHERFDRDFWQALNKGLRLNPGKICLASGFGTCSEQIVAAHSIQKSELKKLARSDGHVYSFLLSAKSDHRNFHWPEPAGINEVTTFTGICSYHDNCLFKAIETHLFTASREQLFLTHYRAVLFEYYRRTKLYNKLNTIYLDLESKGHSNDFTDILEIIHANNIDSSEIEIERSHVHNSLISGDFTKQHFACWVSDSPAPVAGVIFIGPTKDFLGNRIQHISHNSKLEWVTLTVTPKDGKTVFVIGSNVESSTSRQLIESFESISPDKRMQTLIGYCLCCMEDLVLMPHFWESLNKIQQESIIRTYKARLFPRKMPNLGKWTLIRQY